MISPTQRTEWRKIAEAVEQHFVNNGWKRPDRPVFGYWDIFSDNGKGMGRQHIAAIHANRHYGFTEVATHIATFDPPTILSLLDALDEQDAELAELRLAICGGEDAPSHNASLSHESRLGDANAVLCSKRTKGDVVCHQMR